MFLLNYSLQDVLDLDNILTYNNVNNMVELENIKVPNCNCNFNAMLYYDLLGNNKLLLCVLKAYNASILDYIKLKLNKQIKSDDYIMGINYKMKENSLFLTYLYGNVTKI